MVSLARENFHIFTNVVIPANGILMLSSYNTETPIVNKLQLSADFLASPKQPEQIPEIKFHDPSKDEQASPVEIINEPEIIPETIVSEEHVEQMQETSEPQQEVQQVLERTSFIVEN